MWRPGRDTFHQFHQGMPDGDLVAALLKAATGPPPKVLTVETALAQDAPLPPNHSPYFHVAAHVAKATVDFDLNRTLTPADLSRRLGERRREAQNDNRQYSQDIGHKMFGSSKCVFHSMYTPSFDRDSIILFSVLLSCVVISASTLVTIFGGRLNDIYTLLTEERLPDGWESRVRDQMGLTMTTFNRTVFRVELGIEDEIRQPLNLM
jgi:hypothetical protein